MIPMCPNCKHIRTKRFSEGYQECLTCGCVFPLKPGEVADDDDGDLR